MKWHLCEKCAKTILDEGRITTGDTIIITKEEHCERTINIRRKNT